MADLFTLLDQYGGMGDIPEADLAAIGMARVERDGGVEILPVSKLEKQVEEETRRVGGFSGKAIFGVLPASVPLNDIDFSYISQDRVNRFVHLRRVFFDGKYDKRERTYDTYNFMYNSPLDFFENSLEYLIDFRENLKGFMQNGLGFNQYEVHSIIEGISDSLGWYDPFFELQKYEEVETKCSFVTGVSSELTKNVIKEAYDSLENSRSKVLDSPLFRKAFDEVLKDKSENLVWKEDLKERCYDYKENREIPLSPIASRILDERLSLADVLLEVLPAYLADKGLDDIAQGARDCESIDSLRQYLGNVRKSDLPGFTLQKILGKQMKGKTVEEKRAISTQLKEAKADLKIQQGLIEAMKDYISMYEVVGSNVANYFRKMQECISSSSAAEMVSLYLDGRANVQEDKDPGKLVGDCTEGKPLPFYMPTVHNVKVRPEADAEAIGSVYLFETKNYEDGRKVWHLDAIQIPKRGNWEAGTQAILDSIVPEAIEAGVEYITVNDDWNLISNFDYVGEGVISYHNKSGLGMTKVNLEPFGDVGEQNSSPQGRSEQRILWKAVA